MAAIVEYTDQKPPGDRDPHRIFSPPRPGVCCFLDMEWLDAPRTDPHCVYQYRRCRQCGFAIRVILQEIPDEAPMASLREELAHSLGGNIPE